MAKTVKAALPKICRNDKKKEVLRRAPPQPNAAIQLLQDLRAGHVHADRRAREVLVNGSAVVGRKCPGARLSEARRGGRRMVGRLRRRVVAGVRRCESGTSRCRGRRSESKT